MYDADAVLLCDPEVLISEVGDLVAPWHVVGPCSWEPEGQYPDRLNDLLLVSLGSTGKSRGLAEVVERLRRALKCGASVWVKTQTDKKGDGPYVRYLSNVPLSPILRRSALTVTQGGAGSTYLSLLRGGPGDGLAHTSQPRNSG